MLADCEQFDRLVVVDVRGVEECVEVLFASVVVGEVSLVAWLVFEAGERVRGLCCSASSSLVHLKELFSKWKIMKSCQNHVSLFIRPLRPNLGMKGVRDGELNAASAPHDAVMQR